MLRCVAVVAVIVVSVAMPSVLANSAGAPINICTNNLTPEHGLDGQSSAPPYVFKGANSATAGAPYKLTLAGEGFLGFAVQARDVAEKPIGQFKIIESAKSQTLTCSGPSDTVTHKKINSEQPITSVEFEWTAPAKFEGVVHFVGTVAKNGGTYWIRKVVKEIKV